MNARMTPERLDVLRVLAETPDYGPVMMRSRLAELIAELAAITAERDAMRAEHAAYVALHGPHAAVPPYRSPPCPASLPGGDGAACTCAQPTEAYGALAGPCDYCVERAKAAT